MYRWKRSRANSRICERSGSLIRLLEGGVSSQCSVDLKSVTAASGESGSKEHDALNTGWFNSLTQCKVTALDSRACTRRAASSGEVLGIIAENGLSGSSLMRRPR